MGSFEVPVSQIASVSFSVYRKEDILNLSVQEITNPVSLDALLHPTYGGLYDSALGPTDVDDVCRTCGQNTICCPGHLGHINLPVPAYNPLLFSTMIKILPGSCFKCHRLKAKEGEKQVMKCQLIALEHGFISLVDEMQEMYDSIVTDANSSEDSHEDIVSKVNRCLKDALKGKCNNEELKKMNVKNVVVYKQYLCKEFIMSLAKKKNCPHCGMPSRPIRTENKARVFFYKGLAKGVVAKYIMKQKLKVYSEKKKKNLDPEKEVDMVEELMDKENDEMDTLDREAMKAQEQVYLTPSDIRNHMKELWKSAGEILSKIFGTLDGSLSPGSHPTDVFFLDVIAVPPSRFRPIAELGGMRFENSQTANLSRVVKDTITIRDILRILKEQGNGEVNDSSQTPIQEVHGSTAGSDKTLYEKLNNAWTTMQTHINCLTDENLDKLSKDKHPGIKQMLEKKQGLFRMNMMGKRVNYACRSVISPDPYINTNEIGIPMVFATKLTYPEPVTPWNFQELKQAVLNGPNKHPGACIVEHEDGTKIKLHPTSRTRREALAYQLLTRPLDNTNIMRSKKVHRHLKNGDVLLLNRQPTLHRPSIQAHRARVLPGEKTLRLHYANCKAYNADFDGDEMNAHFPQDEISRAEAYTIAATDFQYLVPKDGTPLAGLIQDHMVSGVMLTLRGRFFCRADYQQLVFGALTDKDGPIREVAPSILKPQQLWSGKQVLSTVLINIIPKDKPLLNLQGKAKIAARAWLSSSARPWMSGGTPVNELEMTESEVVILQGELLVGVLDKGHYGPTPYGLVHSCYELYGGPTAGRLLTSLSKLFTCFLQLHGFTLGVEDILCKAESDKERVDIIEKSTHCGSEVVVRAFNVAEDRDLERLKQRYEEAHFSKDDELKDMDLAMKGKTDEIQNAIAKVIIPGGLLKGFPSNNLQLMVQSGAKGSSVNCMQISCLLGQIELEGRRPALMMSGRALPSFAQYDASPRSGGFVAGRFLTGIRPQEYFYHCMAGREGLVDTAVKTSRSGYLQRCIIKHLEGLIVNYDQTVRDSDGSIVQFHYGEDGLDIPRTQFFIHKQIPFLVSNKKAVVTEQDFEIIEARTRKDVAHKLWRKFKKWKKHRAGNGRCSEMRHSPFLKFSEEKCESVKNQHSDELTDGRSSASTTVCQMWAKMSREEKKMYMKMAPPCPDPVISCVNPASNLGAVSENFEELIDSYLRENPDGIVVNEEDRSAERGKILDADLRQLLYVCNIHAQVQPGEAVGLLAAQSIGEPSTQMTLNTFHFAGRGEMNVTLGIPRLREILMIASKNIKTPNMDIPILNTKKALKNAKSLRKKLSTVHLSEVLENVEVVDKINMGTDRSSGRCREYTMRFNFLPYEMYRERFYLNPSGILHYMESVFFNRLTSAIKQKAAHLSKSRLVNVVRIVDRRPAVSEENDPAEAEDVSDVSDGELEDAREERDYDGEKEEREAVGDDEDEENSEAELESGEGSGEDEGSSDGQAEQTIGCALTREKKKHKARQKMSSKRVNNVLTSIRGALSYKYDPDEALWCEIVIQYGLLDQRLDLLSLLETEAKKAVVYQIPGISRCFLTEGKGDSRSRIKVEGYNLQKMYEYSETLDLNLLYTNNIHAIANTYGIEAASQAIIKEIRDVFAAYGIEVDYRHLSLVADYMTFEGSYRAFNRHTITSNPSPFQKMSFETTMHFLTSATIGADLDDLKSPSSRIIVGRTVQGGTGCFDVLQPVS